MLRRFLLALFLVCASASAWAQGCGSNNPNCIVPTRPVGDSTNAAANTAWVGQNTPTFTSGVGIPQFNGVSAPTWIAPGTGVATALAQPTTGSGGIVLANGPIFTGTTFISPAAANASLALTAPSNTYQASIAFNTGGTNNWQLGKQIGTDDYFFIYNIATATTSLKIDAVTNAVAIGSTTASTTTGTGALVVNGGEGIAGALNAGGNANFGGVLTLSNYTSPGSLGVQYTTGQVNVGGYRDAARDYGCDPTGVVDATTCLSTAFNSGYPIQLIGKFVVSGPITVTLSASSTPNGLHVVGMNQQQSQILLTSASAAINISVQYNSDYINGNTQVVLKDFSLVEKYAGAGASSSSGSPSGMMNISAQALSGAGYAGITADNLEMSNVSFLGDGTGWNYVGLYLKDLRYIHVSTNMQNCIGAANGSSGASGSAAILFATTNLGSYQNAPAAIFFQHNNITGGDYGIRFLPSGATTGTMDPQGVWINDNAIIGNGTASIYLAATDVNNAEWHVKSNTLGGNNYGIYMSGLGSVRVTDNTVVVGSTTGYGIYYDNGTVNTWPSGQIMENVVFGSGTSYAIGGTIRNNSGVNGRVYVEFNSSGNASGGYTIGGAATISANNW